MSNGKRKNKRYVKRTYTEKELVRAVKMAVDEATKKLILIYGTAVADKYNATEEDLLDLLNIMQRYQRYEDEGLVPFKKFGEVLEKHGIELKPRRW